ncbi:hypothetical protein F511_32156 [Dorcoceras hygrometricum]|uniref:Cleavage stimulation factor subunit 2-like n=1 Tax=Dorcoceras hygrometricum TaxID=472368 RepID=A0A2Z7A2C8_9LAMI|nr:hypothetical protein F511_32156 [Dorcoceras hygrometricum]
MDGNSSKSWPEQIPARGGGGDGGGRRRRYEGEEGAAGLRASTCVTLNGSGIQLAVGPQPLRLRNHNFGLAQRIMVKRLATSRHDPLDITDSACKNQLVVVSVQYGPFNPYIPIRSTTIGKSRVARDPITMHTSWRSNSDITSVTSLHGQPDQAAQRQNLDVRELPRSPHGQPDQAAQRQQLDVRELPRSIHCAVLSSKQISVYLGLAQSSSKTTNRYGVVKHIKSIVGDPDPPPGRAAEERKTYLL